MVCAFHWCFINEKTWRAIYTIKQPNVFFQLNLCVCFHTLSDPDSEDTEEADECCWGLEMDMGESALWGDAESLCCSSEPTRLRSTQLDSGSDTGSFGGETGEEQVLDKDGYTNYRCTHRFYSCHSLDFNVSKQFTQLKYALTIQGWVFFLKIFNNKTYIEIMKEFLLIKMIILYPA